MGGTSEGQVLLSTTAIEDTFNNCSENVMSREQIWSRLYSKFKHNAFLVENEDECSKVEDQLDIIIYSSTSTEVRMSEDVFGTTDHSGRKEGRVQARYICYNRLFFTIKFPTSVLTTLTYDKYQTSS